MSMEPGRNVPIALAEVAHELRAPLGGIEAMAELLGETATSPDQERLIAGLKAAAAHLRAVASEVIDAARGNTLTHPAAADFSLRGLLDGVSAAADARARAKGLTFHLTIDDSLPATMHGEGLRVRQMLENLLDNAFKVTAAGSVSLAVRQVDRRNDFVGLLFEVRDTGPGLSMSDREKLFRTFSRVDNGVPGSGLGLSLVARMARSMGGDAGCESEPGNGAMFWFTLRLPVKGKAADTQASTGDAPVLVVDDNHANRTIMRAILEHFGHAVVDAATGEEALDIVRAQPIKAVMLDQTLPGLSGLETLRELRASQGSTGLIPVVPVTGRVAPEDKAAFAAAGANGFVEKPVNARAIRDALEAALASRAAAA
jgi:two-component system, sensor histidine kinase